MSTINVVNPGLVNVADQSDGLVTVDQPVTVSPSMTARKSVDGGNLAPGKGTAQPSPSDVTPSMTARTSVDAGTASPTSPNTINSTENTVIGQPTSTEQFFETIEVYP